MKEKIRSICWSKGVSKKPSIPLILLCASLLLISVVCTGSIGVEDDFTIQSNEDPGLNDYDREPMPEALEALESDENVTVTEEEDDLDSITFEPVDEDPVVGMAFGAGGDVDPRAYAPAARAVAEEGYFVVLFYPGTGMPDGGPFGDVIENYPEIENWSVGGHSNGGMNACEYFDVEEPDGLHLWAAYPSPGFIGVGETDLSDKEGEFVSIYGTNDGVTTLDDIEDSEERLPEDTEFVEIEGGNHAQFGWYGEQDGDNEADISREEQQNLTINATLDHLNDINDEQGYELVIDAEEGGTTAPEPGTHYYAEEETITVSADPDEGWVFSHWSGDNDSTEDQITMIMDEDKAITAHFVEDEISTMDIQLDAGGDADGWNFVSFNLDINDTDIVSILENEENGILGNYDRVMYYDASTDEWFTYMPGRADHFNGDINWDETKGLWIRMTADDTLTVEGTELTSTDITLSPGWNMVSYPSSYNGNNGLRTEVTKIGYFDETTDTNIAYTTNTETFDFEPGQGYWLYNDADNTVIWTVDY
ncbi:MAG: alpha/beta hydrolase [Candidatus Saliniplasma sp.]